MVPLMMEEGYAPDGWLGLLLGTRMWYPLYGDTVSQADAFEERMVALCRELGDRGKHYIACGGSSRCEPLSTWHTDTASGAAIAAETTGPYTEVEQGSSFAGMKMSQLRRQAASVGLTRAQLDRADDAADPRGAIITLLDEARVMREPVEEDAGAARLRVELAALSMSELRRRVEAAGIVAEAVDEADDADNPHAAFVELLVSSAPL